MKLRSTVMRGDIRQLWLLVATLALGSVWGSEVCKRGQSWWDRHRELCIPCTKCDPERRLAVKYPCEIHRDTICQSLYEVRIWPFNTPRRSRKDNETSGNSSDYEYYEYVDYDSEVTERNDNVGTWDMQTTSLTLAASGCVVFFLVVIILSLYHAKQWKVLKSVLTSDVQDLTAKLKLMESGGEPSIQPVVSTDHHLYCNVHIGKETLLGSQTGEEFRNRKGYFSLNVQALCNAQLLFMNIVARWPGSAHDATVFNNSVLRAQCESGLYGNRWLLGDSAYPLKPYLLTPVLNPRTRGEQQYNEAHIQTRNCIERCFGVWKRRFPIVSLTLRLSLVRVNAVIVATAVLHNICRLNNLVDIPPEMEIPNEVEVPVSTNADEGNYTERAVLISNIFST